MLKTGPPVLHPTPLHPNTHSSSSSPPRSLADVEAVKTAAKAPYQYYTVQTHAVIDSISMATGAETGGAIMTINGNFFDQTTNTVVKIGGKKYDCLF
jgi:hypothetical protein